MKTKIDFAPDANCTLRFSALFWACLGVLAVLTPTTKADTILGPGEPGNTGVTMSAQWPTGQVNPETSGISHRQIFQSFINGTPSVHIENGNSVNWNWSLKDFEYKDEVGNPHYVADSQVPGQWANIYPDPNDNTLCAVRCPVLAKARHNYSWTITVVVKASIPGWYDSQQKTQTYTETEIPFPDPPELIPSEPLEPLPPFGIPA